MDSFSRDLSLRFRNFFNKDPGHWIPACVGVGVSITATITDPKTHAHLAFVDVVTMPLNMADTVWILRLCSPQVHNTVNWHRSCTFSSIKSEIPAFTAPGTASNSKCSSPVNMEGCVREVLGEHTILGWLRGNLKKSQLFNSSHTARVKISVLFTKK